MNSKQRIQAIGFFVSITALSLVLSGCGLASTPAQIPTQGTAFSATPTAKPTVTATPAPENLADAKDLPVWIEDYVHAYGGKVAVNGTDMDADQVLAAVKATPGSFVEKKTIKGKEVLFFVVNGVPLAIQNDIQWRSILARDISDVKNAQFAMPILWYQTWDPDFVSVIRNANMLTITKDLDTTVIFEKMTAKDWRNLLDDWPTIKTQLDSGKIPDGIPYNWTYTDQWSDVRQIITFAQENHMGLRAQHLVWNGDGVPDSIYNGGFTKDELLKILEFTISVKLIRYKDVISEWNATDELIESQFSDDRWGFWQREVGLMDVTRLSAGLIRKIDPEAKITVADDHELEERFYNQQPGLGIRFMEYVKTLKQEGLIDRVDIENNLWIYDLPEQAYMEKILRQIQAEGIELAAPEITVFPTKKYPLWGPGARQVYAIVDDPLKAHAEGFKRAVGAYINVGAYDLGLGDVGDKISSANYFDPGTNSALFDLQWKPKMGWYEILKVMYDGFFQ